MNKLAMAHAAFTISAATAGCVSVGTNYDAAAVDQIAPGTAMSEVIARLGQPNSRTTLPNGQTQLATPMRCEASMLWIRFGLMPFA